MNSNVNPLDLFIKDRETKSGDLVSIEDIRRNKIQKRELAKEEKRKIHNEKCKVSQLEWINKKKSDGGQSVTIYPDKSLIELLDEYIAAEELPNRTVAFNVILATFFDNNKNN